MKEKTIKMVIKNLEKDIENLGKELFSEDSKESKKENLFLRNIAELEKIRVMRPKITAYDEGVNFIAEKLTNLIKYAAEAGIRTDSSSDTSRFFFSLRSGMENVLSKKEYSIIHEQKINGIHDGNDNYLTGIKKHLSI